MHYNKTTPQLKLDFLDSLPDPTKVCCRCNKRKPFEAFNCHPLTTHGIQSQCKECNKEIQKQWRAEHEDHRRAYNAQRDKQKSRKRDNARYAREYPVNASKYIRRVHQRRLRVLAAGPAYSPEEWQALCDFYDNRCICCGKKVKLTVDHVIPLSKGGSNMIDNIQPLCQTCNKTKHAKIIDYRKSFLTKSR